MIDQDIAKANQRLKTSNMGLVIIRRGSKLSLRGMLPKKNGNGKAQQTIALDVYANPAGLKRAIAEAQKVSGLLALKEFSWDIYYKSPPTTESLNIGDWVTEFEKDYFSRRSRTPQSETTWKNDYLSVFKQLPSAQDLSSSILLAAIKKTKPDTKTRKRFCTITKALANFAKIDFDPSPYKGNYSAKSLTPRMLPTDQEIVQWRSQITDPRWQYVFGLMACYGLRNHEVFNLDLSSLKKEPGILTVLDGKTGSRRVWPFYPEWWDDWHLWDTSLLPHVNGKNNTILGQSITIHLKKYGFFKPYNLRHAWAVRTLELGLDVSLASQQMGHSLKVHCDIYHHWITERTHQRAFELMMTKRDRPLPP